MKDVRYKQFAAIQDTKGNWTHSNLFEFCLRIPEISFAMILHRRLPPLPRLNALFNSCVCEQGMSGRFEWKSFTITSEEYEELKLEVQTSPIITNLKREGNV